MSNGLRRTDACLRCRAYPAPSGAGCVRYQVRQGWRTGCARIAPRSACGSERIVPSLQRTERVSVHARRPTHDTAQAPAHAAPAIATARRLGLPRPRAASARRDRKLVRRITFC